MGDFNRHRASGPAIYRKFNPVANKQFFEAFINDRLVVHKNIFTQTGFDIPITF